MKKEKDYKKLPGVGFFSSGRSVWRGRDHLLLVDKKSFSEYYKRFYFKDIEGFVVRKTKEWLFWFLFVLSFDLLWVGIFLFNQNRFPIFSAIFCTLIGIFSIGCILILSNGESCKVQIRTSVHLEKISSLNTVKKFKKFLLIIHPLITEAQGEITQQNLESLTEKSQSLSSPTSFQSESRNAPYIQPLNEYKGRYHKFLFWVLLADLPISSIGYFFPAFGLTSGFAYLWVLAVMVFSILSLSKQRNSKLPGKIKTLTVFSFLFTMLTLVISIVYTLFLVIDNPNIILNMNPSLYNKDPISIGLMVLTTGVNILLAISGFRYLKEFANKFSTPPPIPESQVSSKEEISEEIPSFENSEKED